MKRRIRRIRRALKRAGLYNAFHITLIAVLLIGFCVILFNVKEPEQQEEKPETTQAEVIQRCKRRAAVSGFHIMRRIR